MNELLSRFAEAQSHKQELTPANQPPAPKCAPPMVTITRFRPDRVEIVERTGNKSRVVSRVKYPDRRAA